MVIYGHRGAAGEAPENTIAACRHGIDRGLKFVEVDLRLSADGQLVVLHDNTLRRTTGNQSRVHEMTAAAMAKLDARRVGPPWPRKRDAQVPTLERLLRQTSELAGYQLEVKPDSKTRVTRIAKLLAERFDTPKAASKIVVISSDYHLHAELGDMAPHVRRGMVATRLDAYPVARELECDVYCTHWSSCLAMLVRQLHRLGMEVGAWTVNDAQVLRNLHRMKVDSVTTDYPSMALPLLAELERSG